jgi:hypothetical protein
MPFPKRSGSAIDRPTGTYAQKLEARHRVHVTGLKGSSSLSSPKPSDSPINRSILIVYPDEESAQDAVSDFRTLSNGRVVHFPERTIAPHRFELRENLAAGGDRNESLLTILNGGADVVVTSVLGLLEKTITKKSLSAHQRTWPRVTGSISTRFASTWWRWVTTWCRWSKRRDSSRFVARSSTCSIPHGITRRASSSKTTRSCRSAASTSTASARWRRCSRAPFCRRRRYRSTRMVRTHLRRYLKERGFDQDLIERIADEAEHSRSSFVWRRYAPALGMTGALLDFFPEPPVVWLVGGESINRSLAKRCHRLRARGVAPRG